jgi:glycosyltransferase involved in cell wall biosynthesis
MLAPHTYKCETISKGVHGVYGGYNLHTHAKKKKNAGGAGGIAPHSPHAPLTFRYRTLTKHVYAPPGGGKIMLTAVLITKNEAKTITKCLDSLHKVVSSIIIIDTGSTDGTETLAQVQGAHVGFLEWEDDFAKARNAAWSLVKTPWALSIDADEVLTPIGAKALRAAITVQQKGPALYSLPYELVGGHPMQAVRLAYKPEAFHWVGAVHEYLCPKTPIEGFRATALTSDPMLRHIRPEDKHANDKNRNLRILEREYEKGDRSPRTLYYLGRELQWNGLDGRAIPVLEEYLAAPAWHDEEVFARVALSECYLACGMSRKALQAARGALRISKWRECYVAEANALYVRGEKCEAYISLVNALEVGPTKTTLWVNAGLSDWTYRRAAEIRNELGMSARVFKRAGG